MILLDTHTFLWFVNDTSRLPMRVNNAIEDAEDVYISIASFWEMTIKSSLGKLDLPASISQMMEDCSKMDLSLLPIKSGHLEKLQSLPWIHRDPFDRLLVAQAQDEKLTLVTADGNIARYDVSTFW